MSLFSKINIFFKQLENVKCYGFDEITGIIPNILTFSDRRINLLHSRCNDGNPRQTAIAVNFPRRGAGWKNSLVDHINSADGECSAEYHPSEQRQR